MADADAADLVRSYYGAIDAGDYDTLAGLLAPEFVHRRPDRTLEGRDRFVAFMRDERPETETTHAIGAVYTGDGGVAARGRLLHGDGTEWFAFVDAFDVAAGAIVGVRTYTA